MENYKYLLILQAITCEFKNINLLNNCVEDLVCVEKLVNPVHKCYTGLTVSDISCLNLDLTMVGQSRNALVLKILPPSSAVQIFDWT